MPSDAVIQGQPRARDAQGAVGGLIHLHPQMDKTGAHSATREQARPPSACRTAIGRGMRPRTRLIIRDRHNLSWVGYRYAAMGQDYLDSLIERQCHMRIDIDL